MEMKPSVVSVLYSCEISSVVHQYWFISSRSHVIMLTALGLCKVKYILTLSIKKLPRIRTDGSVGTLGSCRFSLYQKLGESERNQLYRFGMRHYGTSPARN